MDMMKRVLLLTTLLLALLAGCTKKDPPPPTTRTSFTAKSMVRNGLLIVFPIPYLDVMQSTVSIIGRIQKQFLYLRYGERIMILFINH